MTDAERCTNPPTHIRFWPGKTIDFVCDHHAADTRDVSQALEMDAGKVLQALSESGLEDAKMTKARCACSAGRIQKIVIRRSGNEEQL